MSTKILIIEDDPSAARMMGYAFEHEGYTVHPAQNGLEGMHAARTEHPDMIILDVMLPGIDGFEVCSRLKTSPDTSDIPIIMISAKGQSIDFETAQKVGADEYIVKPVDPTNLIAKVEGYLTKTGA